MYGPNCHFVKKNSDSPVRPPLAKHNNRHQNTQDQDHNGQ